MFLISSHHHSKYGFGILSQTITAVLPKRQREVHALAFTQRLNAEINFALFLFSVSVSALATCV